MFSPNLSIINLVIRELHLSKVEGVVVEFMEGFPGQSLSGVLFQIFIPPKSTIGFVSNLK